MSLRGHIRDVRGAWGHPSVCKLVSLNLLQIFSRDLTSLFRLNLCRPGDCELCRHWQREVSEQHQHIPTFYFTLVYVPHRTRHFSLSEILDSARVWEV